MWQILLLDIVHYVAILILSAVGVVSFLTILFGLLAHLLDWFA